MLPALSHTPGRYAIREYGTHFISWGVAILLMIIGFPVSVQLIKQLLQLLYEVLLQYRY